MARACLQTSVIRSDSGDEVAGCNAIQAVFSNNSASRHAWWCMRFANHRWPRLHRQRHNGRRLGLVQHSVLSLRACTPGGCWAQLHTCTGPLLAPSAVRYLLLAYLSAWIAVELLCAVLF